MATGASQMDAALSKRSRRPRAPKQVAVESTHPERKQKDTGAEGVQGVSAKELKKGSHKSDGAEIQQEVNASEEDGEGKRKRRKGKVSTTSTVPEAEPAVAEVVPTSTAPVSEVAQEKTREKTKKRKAVNKGDTADLKVVERMAPLTEEKTEGLQDVAEGKARSKRRKVDKADTVGASSVSPKKAEGVLTPRKSALKVTKVPSPVPEPEVPESDEDSDAPVQADGSSDEEDVHLHGFSTDEDSSDDDMDGDVDGFDVELLPTIAKDDATVKRKLARAKREPTVDRGVVCLSRIPHGFYEQQMKAYFSQFGEVTRLRLSRNKKTGRSKHYGFIEFDSSSVAKIVAETMDNYLLMGHILSCKLIPKDDVHPELWVGANRKWRAVPMDRVARVKHNKPRTVSEQLTVEKRLVKRQEARKRKLAEQGIKYDFDAVAYKRKPMVQQP